ncbi:phage baseplate protein [Candidatus Magnetobacterium casense]|uniref:Dit-like phage tail protein N-terminal domain-containing protein n=1 Tax=Candidatus Magnetobacterium casense TaxID=1455061 RepID=A0ABS6RWH5_9BACT|nr:hypothetical protein [Candidatus Magnetobacterium casensis]MBV6340985.1 hypothetical protein [Candidatus Magnetobacterium casensis]
MGLPTNIADAASQIKDGVLGAVETIMIGDVMVSALTGLSGGNSVEITRKPIEAGFATTDAAVDVPVERVLDICLANPDFSVEAGIDAALTGSVSQFTETWRDKKDKLYKYLTDKELIDVQTHEALYENMLIQSIEPKWDVDDNADAFFATVTVVEITQITNATDGGVIDAAESSVGGL